MEKNLNSLPGLDLRSVHVFRKVPGTADRHVLAEVHPACSFSQQGEETVWLQDGQFYTSGGKAVKKLPQWVIEALQRTNARTLAECGYKGPPKGQEAKP